MKRNRDFLFLMVGQSLSNVGDVLYVVAVISFIFEITKSAAASAIVPFTITFAMFISSILTPILIGRVNLKKLLVGSQIGKTVILFGLSAFMMSGLALTNYYFVFFMIAGIALLDGCANPIRQTLIPYYVEKEHLIKANGIVETITQSIQIGTWFFGSLLLIVFSPNQLILVVALLFVLSSFILALLKNVNHKAERQERMRDLITQGWQTIRVTPVLKTLAKMEFMETVANSVWIAAILIVYVKQALNTQEQWWGFINSAFFIGLVLGSLLCVKFPRFLERNQYRFITVGIVLNCFFTILFSLTSVPLVALLLSALIGVFGQLKNIPQQTIIQTSIPKEQLATVYTSFGTISTGTFGVGSLIMGLISDYLGVRSVFAISGGLLAVVFVIVVKDRRILKGSTQRG
ncbi:MFS transporter [Paenibacillus sp. BSR1-1]|uniref:MFS transporter n=1 Tax=Paenibacillus sp. BSR1-1 TaxID=3020845 RepID=UPI0025B0FC3B|nr:MFS transporter [Paenibacillus sp. BSR1-1]MDN3019154.1 MFS transporter [Paenibacillus sp. BSR1-1]